MISVYRHQFVFCSQLSSRYQSIYQSHRLPSRHFLIFLDNLIDNLIISSVSRDVIVQAWQLRDFLFFGHQSGNLIDQTSRLIIDRLIENFLRPVRITSTSFSIIVR